MDSFTSWVAQVRESTLAAITWSNFEALANSNFFSSITGALAGAFAGAYIAHRILERAKIREELAKEIRHINAALSLAFNICNSVLVAKGQHIAPLYIHLNETRASVIEHQRNIDAGEADGRTEFQFDADLKTLPSIPLPVDILREQVFDNLTVTGRPLSLVMAAEGAATSLNSAISARNKLIETFKALPENRRAEFINLYLGLPFRNGHTNSEYPDSVEAVYRYTDDVVFFASLLCTDLRSHGEKKLEEYKMHSRGKRLQLTNVDFSKASAAGLMPKDEDYEDWLTSFQSSEKGQ